VPQLLNAVAAAGLLGDGRAAYGEGDIALVIATHPHLDHVAGIPELFDTFPDAIAELWDPGYFHTLPSYHAMMARVEEHSRLLYAQPTSGLRRWIGEVSLTVLAPSVQLRNKFDSYGVQINDASISVRIDFPASRVEQRDDRRNLIDLRRRQSLILGADAQTMSWSHVLTDFPYLAGSNTDVANALKMATGFDPLKGNVLKISHHASKHGVSLELVERIDPNLTLVSSVGAAGSYNFPHTVAQELIREALEPTTTTGKAHKKDYEQPIFYTCDTSEQQPLGTVGVVIKRGGGRTVWRFGDEPDDDIDLAAGARMTT
jgi:ribonuclease BN (tRNA processing enzyme)